MLKKEGEIADMSHGTYQHQGKTFSEKYLKTNKSEFTKLERVAQRFIVNHENTFLYLSQLISSTLNNGLPPLPAEYQYEKTKFTLSYEGEYYCAMFKMSKYIFNKELAEVSSRKGVKSENLNTNPLLFIITLYVKEYYGLIMRIIPTKHDVVFKAYFVDDRKVNIV